MMTQATYTKVIVAAGKSSFRLGFWGALLTAGVAITIDWVGLIVSGLLLSNFFA